MINIQTLVDYAIKHPQLILIDKKDDLMKLNYTKKTIYNNLWNQYTIVCRGIIIDATNYEIIAYPFDKFFNAWEYKQRKVNIPYHLNYWVTEKLDGVLIIPYQYKDRLAFSSRGKFDSEYSKYAKKIATFDNLPLEDYTFIFELISPKFSRGNFLVIEYEKADLVLIGVRNKKKNLLLTPPEVIKIAENLNLTHFAIVDYDIKKIEKLQRDYSRSKKEGWVVFFQNRFLLKIKRLEYLDLVKAKTNLNYKTLLKKLPNKKDYNSFLSLLPEELKKTAEIMEKNIKRKRDKELHPILKIFTSIPKEIKEDQSRFFQYIREKHRSIFRELAKYFHTGSPKNLYPIIYRKELKEIKDLSKILKFFHLLK